MRSITLNNGLDTIGNYAFANCVINLVEFEEGTTSVISRLFDSAKIKNVKLPQYNGMRWRDGDLFKEGVKVNSDTEDKIVHTMTPEVLDECKTNKRDLIRLIGYDPFAT